MRIRVAGLVVAATAMVLAGPAETRAQEATAAAGLEVVSAYIFRGATVSDEVSVQPFVDGTFYGVTLGTWANFNTDASQFDEIDYYASYELPLEDSPVGLSVGYTEYTYPTATATDELTGEASGLEADREVSLSASLDTILSPSAAVYYGIEGPFLEDGLYVELGVSHELAIDEKIGLNCGAALGYEAGDNVADEGFSHLTLTLGGNVGPFTANIAYVVETDDSVLVVDEEVYGGVGITLPL